MKNTTQHTGVLDVIQRLPSSASANPRYLVSIDGYTARTAVDSRDGYLARDFDGRRVTAEIGTHYGVATVANIRKPRNQTKRG